MNIINGVYSEDYNQVGGCIMKNILFIASEGVPFIKMWLDHCRRALIRNIMM